MIYTYQNHIPQYKQPTPEQMQNAVIEQNRQLFNIVVKAVQEGEMVTRWIRFMINEWFEYYSKLI